jgi:hypothetical protein
VYGTSQDTVTEHCFRPRANVRSPYRAPSYRPCSRILNASGSLLLGQWGEPQVRLDNAEVGEQLLGLLVLDRGVDNDVVARNPVDWSGDLVLITGLQRIDDAQDLGAVAAGRGRVGQDGADGLLGVDKEDGADGKGDALLVDVGGILIVKPKTNGRGLSASRVCTTDDWAANIS